MSNGKVWLAALTAAACVIPAVSGAAQLSGDYLHRINAKARFTAFSNLTAADLASIRSNAATTIPTFSGSFSYGGSSYTYIMAGGEPSSGGETDLPTAIQPVAFVFDGTTDPVTGQPYVLDGTGDVDGIVSSPNFQPADYSVGSGLQFQDAVQIAQFYGVSGAGYHTVLAPPRILPTVTITVPSTDASIGSYGGINYALMNYRYFNRTLTSIRLKAHFKPGEIAIVLTDNVFLYQGSTSNCCILGFHTAFNIKYGRNKGSTQTLAWASWIGQGLFGGGFEDVTALSHEIAELVNDPFINNAVPAWEFPGETTCQGNLETGDPVEVLANAVYPVTIGTTLYHPQTEALLQWFTRASPSDAFDGAYSYPDITALTAPAKDCGT